MKRTIWTAAQVFALLVLQQAAWSTTFYVSAAGMGDGLTTGSPADLQAALDAARINGETDTLCLATGVYDASTNGANTFEFNAGLAGSDGLPVMFLGGWNASFSEQEGNREATMLDGGDNARVLYIRADEITAVANVCLENLTIQNGRTTTPAHGAGILATCSSGGVASITVVECLFRCNLASNAVGGAIAAQGPITVEYCDFLTNRSYSGGAVYLWATATPAEFYRTGFSDNSIRSTNSAPYMGWQGCTLFSSSPDLTIEECEIRGMSGGGLVGAGSPLYLSHTQGVAAVINTAFRNSTNLYWGSAIQLWNAGADISGCLFANNRAGYSLDGRAAVTYYNSAGPAENIRIVNSTFVGNRSASDWAGDLDFRGGNLTVANSIFDNTTQCSVYCYEGCAGTIDYCDIELSAGGVLGLTYGGHNTNLDPHFQAGDSDYKLNYDSPLIDAGNNAAVPDDLLFDFKGAPRIFANQNRSIPVVDMGWDEYFDATFELAAPAEWTSWFNDGNAKTIAWTFTNIEDYVHIALWQGSPEDSVKVLDLATVPCADQSYAWIIPDDLPDASDYAIVIVPSNYPTLERVAAPIAIQHLRLTYPNQGNLCQGSTYTITWASQSLTGATIRIELYKGDTPARTIAAAAPNTGSYPWKIPFGQAPGSAYRIRISTSTPMASEDYSDRAFTILSAITLTAPNGGQSWKRGTTQRIAWKYKNKPGKAVRLELYKNGVFNRTIEMSTPIGAGGVGSYRWTIPATLRPGAAYTIKVRSLSYPKVFDFSNRAFSITK